MENESRLKEYTEKFTTWLNGQEWYQQLKSKWDELDPVKQLYVVYGFLAMTAGAVALFSLFSIIRVYSLRSNLEERAELLNFIQNANQEMQNLKRSTSAIIPPGGAATKEPAKDYLNSLLSRMGISAENIIISDEKAGPSSDQTDEILIDVTLDQINVRQLVELGKEFQKGSRPIKVRNLQVKTQGADGYLNAKFALSAFNLKQ